MMVQNVYRSVLLAPVFLVIFVGSSHAQNGPARQATSKAVGGTTDKQAGEADEKPPQVSPAVKELQPLFRRIKAARSTRGAVDLSADTVIDGAVIGSQKSSYQVASLAPNQFTIYLKDETQRTRIYNDGKVATIALSPLAYTTLSKPLQMQETVFNLPLPLGPYPEVLLALSLAGVDPGKTFTAGNKTVDLVDRDPFRGETPALHFAGVQDDDVRWDLWITQGDKPKPLRLVVDLSDMLRANGSLEMPDGYQYLLRFDFKLWYVNNRADPSMFVYSPIKDAKEFESVDAYFESVKENQAKAKQDRTTK